MKITPGRSEKIAMIEHRDDDYARKERTLLLLNSLNKAVKRGCSFNEVLSVLSRETKKIFACSGATAYIIDENGEYLVAQKQMLGSSLIDTVEKIIGMKIPETRVPLRKGSLYYKVLEEGRAQVINDSATIQQLMAEFTDNKFLKKFIPAIHKALNIQSVINVPLVAGGKMIGLLDISRSEPFAESDLVELEAISEQLTLILKHKQAEDSLKESKEKFSGIVESIPDAMIMVDEHFTIVWINTVVTKILNFSEPDLIGKKCYSIFLGRERICEPCIVKKTFCDGKIHEFEKRWLIDGRGYLDFWCTSSVAARYDNGRPKMVVELLRDITERKQAEKKLKKTKEELEKQNIELKKVDKIKDSLIRDVTHELKTPVAKHSMHMELLCELLKKHDLMEEARYSISIMKNAIARQEEVIRNILDLSRLEAGGRKYRKKRMRIDQIITNVLEEYNYAIERYGIEIIINLKRVEITSDAEMLSLVFSNIINNSIKYRRDDVTPVINISCMKKDKMVMVVIKDNGIGLPVEEEEKVFERFYQVSPTAAGSGVGLTIARIITEDLGGRICLESHGINRGATVSVELPLVYAGNNRDTYMQKMLD